MKKFFAILLFPFAAMAQQVTLSPAKITTDVNYPAVSIRGTTNQSADYLTIKDETGTIFKVTTNGSLASLSVTATTNQIVFGSTNTAPANTTNVAAWVSVQVSGNTNRYRLPLYK